MIILVMHVLECKAKKKRTVRRWGLGRVGSENVGNTYTEKLISIVMTAEDQSYTIAFWPKKKSFIRLNKGLVFSYTILCICVFLVVEHQCRVCREIESVCREIKSNEKRDTRTMAQQIREISGKKRTARSTVINDRHGNMLTDREDVLEIWKEYI